MYANSALFASSSSTAQNPTFSSVEALLNDIKKRFEAYKQRHQHHQNAHCDEFGVLRWLNTYKAHIALCDKIACADSLSKVSEILKSERWTPLLTEFGVLVDNTRFDIENFVTPTASSQRKAAQQLSP